MQLPYTRNVAAPRTIAQKYALICLIKLGHSPEAQIIFLLCPYQPQTPVDGGVRRLLAACRPTRTIRQRSLNSTRSAEASGAEACEGLLPGAKGVQVVCAIVCAIGRASLVSYLIPPLVLGARPASAAACDAACAACAACAICAACAAEQAAVSPIAHVLNGCRERGPSGMCCRVCSFSAAWQLALERYSCTCSSSPGMKANL